MSHLEDRILNALETIRETEVLAVYGQGARSVRELVGKTGIKAKEVREILDMNNLPTERAEKVLDAFYSGVRSYDGIAEETGLSYSAICLALRGNRLKLPRRENCRTTKNRIKIREAIASGARTKKEIAIATGLSYQAVCNHLGGKVLKSSDSLKEEDLRKVRKAIAGGATTRMEIARVAGLSYPVVIRNIPLAGSRIEHDCYRKLNRELADRLISEGVVSTLAELGRQAGVSGERIRQYMGETGQRGRWKNAQVERREAIGNAVLIALQGKYNRASWAEQNAFEYASGLKRRGVWNSRWDDLVNLFKVYHGAKESGGDVPIEELGERSGFHKMSVSKVLRRTRLKTLCSPIKRVSRKEVERRKENVQQCYGLGLSAADIAHFSGLAERSITTTYKIKGRNCERLPCRGLTYRVASDIYEAMDHGGFSIDDALELTGASGIAVQTALARRAEYSAIIRKALKIFHPSRRKEGKPYLAIDERKKIYGKKGLDLR
ncbi:MAG: hypothetical protein KJ600_05830 [Nanoarchaeota archaeon]|nr:hypothetical protein [Nanoarchaeota archaeon]